MLGSAPGHSGYGSQSSNSLPRASPVPHSIPSGPNSAPPVAQGSFTFRWPAPQSTTDSPRSQFGGGSSTQLPTPLRFGGTPSLPGSAHATPRIRGKRSIWNDYERKKTLGTGAYGRVYLAVDKRSGTHVAIKRTVMPSEDGAFLNPTTLREITILKKLKGHPNIVGCVDTRVVIDLDWKRTPFEPC